MKQTILSDWHTSAGATWREDHNWQIVDQYGDPVTEHHSVRTMVGLIDLSHRGKLIVKGRDRAQFLQGMVTNDMKALTEGRGCQAALLTVKGKMLADLKFYAQRDFFLADVEDHLVSFVIQTLDRFIIVEDVQLVDATDEYALMGVHGPKAKETLRSLFPELPELADDFASTPQPWENEEAIITRQSYTGEEGFDIYIARDAAASLWQKLHQAVMTRDGRTFGYRALNSLRLEAGIPWYGIDMTDDTFPPEAHLDRTAISYTKGCYVGQETIARIKSRGHCNRFLMGFKLSVDLTPASGSRIYHDEKDVGWITSSVFSPSLNEVISMGYLRHEIIEAKESVEVEVGQERVEAIVVELPFYRRAAGVAHE